MLACWVGGVLDAVAEILSSFSTMVYGKISYIFSIIFEHFWLSKLENVPVSKCRK